MILTVTEPIWSQFISDTILLHVVYTLRLKSLELNKSHAVKYHENIASKIHLGKKHNYTGIINFVRLKLKRHLIVTNVCHYRNNMIIRCYRLNARPCLFVCFFVFCFFSCFFSISFIFIHLFNFYLFIYFLFLYLFFFFFWGGEGADFCTKE